MLDKLSHMAPDSASEVAQSTARSLGTVRSRAISKGISMETRKGCQYKEACSSNDFSSAKWLRSIPEQ